MDQSNRQIHRQLPDRQPTIVVCLVAVLVLVGTAGMRGEVIDRVLAIVNGDLITLSDVATARTFGLVSPPAGGDPIRATLSLLIDRALQLDEVDRYAPPEPPTQRVDEELAAIRLRLGTAGAFDRALMESGIDLQLLRELIRENLRISAYLDQRFAGTDARRQQLVSDWLASLRRRAEIVDLYLTRP
jgi:hypothetical protein